MNIHVSGLTKYYGKGELRTAVLQDVSFEIAPGEFVAIMGTSGSGKTTLLNLMGGLDSTYEGDVQIAGAQLDKLSERRLAALRNARFGFVFQQFHLLDHLTSVENITLPRFFDKDAADEEAARARATSLLERLGLGDKLDATPPELSGGQQQRVAIARALVNDPEMISGRRADRAHWIASTAALQLMEPVSPSSTEEDAITMVLVTHEEDIAAHARRILRLEDGVLISDTPNDPIDPEATTLDEGAAKIDASSHDDEEE